VFVVSLARSGSTLLRYLLDSHPQVASPPELNLSALLTHVVETWTQANRARGKPSDPGGPVPADILRRARRVTDEVMQTIADDVGASVFCDKSLTTVDHLPLVQQCYPKATFIFLYRYPLDFIASGIEACQWGYSGYGFAPYVAGNVSNFVAGLGNYWIDRVSRMLNFEANCAAARARLYYELLCDDPDGTLRELLELLDLDVEHDLLARTFDADHGHGPGDYKIDFTSGVSPQSIGRGSNLPQLLGPGQVTQIDELLAQLDYPSLEAGWRGDLPALLGLKSAKESGDEARRIAEEVKAEMQRTASSAVPGTFREFLPMELVVRAGSGNDAYLVVDSEGRFDVEEELPAESRTEHPRIHCAGDVLLRVLRHDITFGQAIRDGRIRFEVRAETTAPQERPRRALAALAAVLDVRAES
jgi:Sulfotransferase family